MALNLLKFLIIINSYSSIQDTMEHPSFTLSALILAGGVAGYAKKKSIPSLAAGVVFAGLFGTAGYLLKQNADWGLELALGSSSLLLAAGLGRGIPSRFSKPVPIILTTLGLLGTAYYGKKYNEFYPIF